jgi:hypothetical protein
VHDVGVIAHLALGLASLKMINVFANFASARHGFPLLRFFIALLALSFPWILLGRHFYTCFICWLVVLLAWFLNIFEKFLTMRI